jgi:DNA-binding CsgD family transcriptional regulator
VRPEQLSEVLKRAKGLSPREVEVCELIVQGLSNKEAANKLFVTEKTVKFHLTNIYKKMNLRSRTQFIVWCQPYLYFKEEEKPAEKPTENAGASGSKYTPPPGGLSAGISTVTEPKEKWNGIKKDSFQKEAKRFKEGLLKAVDDLQVDRIENEFRRLRHLESKIQDNRAVIKNYDHLMEMIRKKRQALIEEIKKLALEVDRLNESKHQFGKPVAHRERW